MPTLPPEPFATSPAQIRRHAWMVLGLGAVAGAAAMGWWLADDWVARALWVAYPYQTFLDNYLQNLRDMPTLLVTVAFALAFFGASGFYVAARSARLPNGPHSRLAPTIETALLAVLALVALLLSHRHWLYWHSPRWDDYWRYAEILHNLLRYHDGQAIAVAKAFFAVYPHSPSPLTPSVVALLMFVFPDAMFWLKALNFAATVGSLLLLRKLSQRLSPDTPFWPLGVLFLANAATARNTAFIQLDAICGFFVVWFFWVWTRWLDSPTRRAWALLIACLTLGTFQKTTLFPLLAIPTLGALFARPRGTAVAWRRVFGVAAATVVPPLLLFGGFLWWLGVTGNFGEQVQLMGTGWNKLDFSCPRFLFATGFLLGPYLPLAGRNHRLREPVFTGLALFVGLFFLSLVVVRGPFWSRYYSLVVAPTLLLALPFLARAAVSGPWRLLLPVYVVAVAAVHYAMMAWQIF